VEDEDVAEVEEDVEEEDEDEEEVACPLVPGEDVEGVSWH